MDVYRARTLAGWRKFLRKGSSGACGRPTRATARLRFSEATTLLKRLLVRADELIAGVSQKVPPKTLRPRRDVRRYVDLYRKGRLKIDELVSATYPIGDMKAAVHDLEAGELAARGVLTLR